MLYALPPSVLVTLAQVTIPPINPTVLLTLLQLVVTVAGAWYAVKAQISKLSEGQTETLRQIGALHKRLDSYGEEIRKLDKKTAVIWDRINRTTQRLAPPAEQDMFGEGESE